MVITVIIPGHRVCVCVCLVRGSAMYLCSLLVLSYIGQRPILISGLEIECGNITCAEWQNYCLVVLCLCFVCFTFKSLLTHSCINQSNIIQQIPIKIRQFKWEICSWHELRLNQPHPPILAFLICGERWLSYSGVCQTMRHPENGLLMKASVASVCVFRQPPTPLWFRGIGLNTEDTFQLKAFSCTTD